MSDATLTAELRSESGSSPARRTRRAGLLPAVVYGLGGEAVSVTVPARELQHILARGANTLITLSLGGQDQLTLARQVQRDPVRGSLLHVDFVRVRADVAVTAEVPFHAVGTAEGVSFGGLLEQSLFSLQVEAKPGDIPAAIEHDISALGIGDQLLVGGLTVPPGVTLRHEPDELVLQVVAPRGQEVAAPAEGAEEPAAASEAGSTEE